MDFLQLLLAINVLILAASLFWIFYLYGKLRQESANRHNHTSRGNNGKLLTKHELEQVRDKALDSLDKTVGHAAKELESSLRATVTNIDTQTQEAITKVLEKELTAYQVSLETMRSQTAVESKKLEKELVLQKTQLLDNFKKNLDQQREVEVDLFNDRLNDVVSGYLVDSLDKNIDLGAQMNYILASMEANKAEIKKDILS